MKPPIASASNAAKGKRSDGAAAAGMEVVQAVMAVSFGGWLSGSTTLPRIGGRRDAMVSASTIQDKNANVPIISDKNS